ncbi:MAG TPA: DUF1329 domain-containing protein [Candidatus Margulisiibacteriota bacterium]|nr:DUF1329 domain-containing protein [Candidatus Margulisiibacteriota bacterium]
MRSLQAAGIVGALALGLGAPHVAAQALPGTTINQTNWQQVSDLLPGSVVDWVRKGDLTLILGSMTDEVAWEPAVMQASEANAGRYDVDAGGNLIERASGQRPPHTYGFPFPHIDPTDAHAGIKIMWNTSLATYKFGRLYTPSAINWIGRGGFERAVRGQVQSMAFDFQPHALPNPDGTESRDLFEALSPASAEGIAALTWRYMDNRPDSVWGYTPALRRVRQLTAANRSDPYLGSDLVQDDGLLWLGKHQSFTWKLAEARDVLVGAVSTSYVHLVPGKQGVDEQEWKSPADFPGARLGLETPGWSGAPWLPTNLIWVRRPVWIVEGYPKDPYYNYGRQIFYVDRSTFKIYYKIVYTPSGEYWKTIFNDLGLGVTADGQERQVVSALLVAVDSRADHASYTKGNAPDFIVEYHSARVLPEQFTVGGLLRRGK